MTDDNPSDEIARIESRLEQLAEVAERCRKIILLAKVAIAIGVALLLAMILGVVAGGELFIAALAAVLGGIVLLGSNVSTLRQTTEAIAAAEVLRSSLIDGIDLRLIGDKSRLG